MRLWAKRSNTFYDMRKVKEEAVLLGVVSPDRLEVKWTAQCKVFEAFVLGAPVARVVAAFKDGLKLLKTCRLEIRIDGQKVVGDLPLLDSHRPLPYAETHMEFAAVEGDERVGIFIPNGVDVEAVVTSDSKTFPPVEISIGVVLYTASAP